MIKCTFNLMTVIQFQKASAIIPPFKTRLHHNWNDNYDNPHVMKIILKQKKNLFGARAACVLVPVYGFPITAA